MKSIREIYKVGPGPSSSHTIGPSKAGKWVKENFPQENYRVKLYASLAATGRGHMTDIAIIKAMAPSNVIFEWHPFEELPEHPNGMIFVTEKEEITVYSVGGGNIRIKGYLEDESEDVYPEKNFSEIKDWCSKKNARLYDYVYHYEGVEIKEFLRDIWKTMQVTVERGLNGYGELPGQLRVSKKAKEMYDRTLDKSKFRREEARERAALMAFAFAVNEENASGRRVVTAPTCGASGVLPAVLMFMKKYRDKSDDEIINALASAAVIGNVIKTNATVSGAEGGCQAEVGSACSMAAVAFACTVGNSINHVERAAEIALEHHLGLTCDPVLGLVQIPCIERNAVAATRAIDASDLAEALQDSKVAFDKVVKIMYETGKDLAKEYRETSQGGLAKHY